MKQVCLAAVSDLHLDQDKNRLRDILWSCEEYVESGVDHLILTGDFVSRTPLRSGFTKKGCRVLFAKIKQDMKEYGLYNSLAASVVPGNHDLRLLGMLTQQMSAAEFLRHFKKLHESAIFMESPYPWVKFIGSVALIGIDSASKASGAGGRIGDAQIQKISDVLDRADVKKRFPILILHHSPLTQAQKRLRRLNDSERFLKAVSGRARVIICGHTHTYGIYRECGVQVIQCTSDLIALLRIKNKELHVRFLAARYEYS